MNKAHSIVRQLAGCALLALAVGATPTFAQSASTAPAADTASDDGAIIVTARKREESLQDVPVAIQAVSAATLERYAVVNLTKVAEMATQVQIYPTSAGSGAVMSIRGINSSNLDPGVDTSVAVNVDGMGISRGRVIREAMFDLQSVEILKGPQALFFGKNSPAGVITIHSADPTSTFTAKARAYYEFKAQEAIGEAVVSGPLSNQLGARLAYQGGTSRGWAKNNGTPRAATVADPRTLPGALDKWLGGYTNHMGRLTLAYDGGAGFKAKLKVLGSTYRGDATAALNEVVGCSGPYPIAGAFVDTGGDCKVNGILSVGALPLEYMGHYRGLEGRADTRGYNKYDSVISTLELSYDLGNVELTSLTGLHHYKSAQLDAFDATPFLVNSGNQTEKSTTWSQEVRLMTKLDGPINAMIGGYYEHMKRDFQGNGTLLLVPADPVTKRWDQWDSTTNVKGHTWSAFGQLIWNVTPEIEIAGGARYTSEKKSENAYSTYVHSLLSSIFMPVGKTLSPTFSDNNVSPEVTVRWKPSQNIMLYAAYKTGYKSGGFSGQVYYTLGDTGPGLTFQAEKSSGFEAGVKGSSSDGKLRYGVTAYTYRFDGIQDTVFNAATLSAAIFNADARTTGIEFDASYRPVEGLSLHAQGGYNDAHYLSFRNAPCFSGQTAAEGCNTNTTGLGGPSRVQDLSGRVRAFAPKWTWGAGFNADIPAGRDYLVKVSGDVNYVGRYLTQVPNTPGSAQKPIMKWDASISFGPENDAWRLALIGKNLTNQFYTGASTDKPAGVRGDIYGQVIRAREVAVEATVKF